MKIFQRLLDLLGAQSVREQNLSRSTRFSRLIFFLLILAIPTLLYGLLAGFQAALMFWLFGLAALLPVIVVFFWSWKAPSKHPKFAFLVAGGLLGFIIFEWLLLGMLIDEGVRNFSLSDTLPLAAFFGMATFIACATLSLLFTMLLHALDRKR